MKHAGIGWPENAGGEHPNVDTILGMPGISRGCTLICSPSARWWYRQARGSSPLVVWRAIPEQGSLPAQLGWNAKRVADACLLHWGEQPHGGTEWFLPLNELQFEREAGAPFPGYLTMADNLRRLRIELRRRFVGTGVKLMFPAWVPQDDGDRLNEWYTEASAWDAVCLHCYGGADTMRARYQSYRAAFPNHPLFVGEWNSNHEDHDERESLKMWAEIANTDAAFLGATYFIWETRNAGEGDLSIWGNPARLALFRDPPTVSLPAPIPEPIPIPVPEPPVMPTPKTREEVIAISRSAAERAAIPELLLLAAGIAESGLRWNARRPTTPDQDASYWPDVSHGVWQQTVRWSQEYRDWCAIDAPGHPPGQFPGSDVTEAAGVHYYDVEHAARVAAGQLAGKYRDGEADAVWRALNRYNYPAGDGEPGTPENGANYRRAIGEAQTLLGTAPDPSPTRAPIPYNADARVDLQPDDFSCSIQSTQWLLRSIGRNPGDAWMEQQLVPAIVSKDVGLLDASGEQLAAWITREYGAEMGFEAHAAPVTFDDVLAGAGVNPTIIGGRTYGPGGHWVGVRRADENGWLELANPAPNYTNTGTHLDRAEWDARGPWSAIYIDRGAVAPAPPVPVPVPQPTRARVLVQEIRDRLEELAGLVA